MVAEIFRERNGRSRKNHRHHWVFDHFEPWSGTVKAGYQPDLFGMMVSDNTVPGAEDKEREFKGWLPPINEEYFQWVDLFESVLRSSDHYTMIDLGADWGRWACRAGMAAKAKGRKPYVVLVEGLPRRAPVACAHMKENGFAPDEFKVISGAVAVETGEQFFAIEQPIRDPQYHDWWGQSLVASSNLGVKPEPTNRTFDDRPVYRFETGFYAVEMPTISLADVLDGIGLVDFLDMDIQGEEGEIVPAFADLLTDRVRLMHIETHSVQVEDRIKSALTERGWVRMRNYTVGKRQETPFGPVFFQGGVQTWINPRLHG